MCLFQSMKWKIILLLLFLFGVPATAQQSNLPYYAHLNITMKAEGGPCFTVCPVNDSLSCCPAYSVSLDENGTVIYNGISGVKTRGEKVHSISVSTVRDLVAHFLRIDFYSLEDRYTEKKLPNGQPNN